MQQITVQNTIQAPASKVWGCWTSPVHIVNWNNASDDWHTPHAENDLRVGGQFLYRMEARDGSASFDFAGTYDEVEQPRHIAYTLEDGRKVRVTFEEKDGTTKVSETFDAESTHSAEMQRDGWQAILDNFKKYVENQ